MKFYEKEENQITLLSFITIRWYAFLAIRFDFDYYVFEFRFMPRKLSRMQIGIDWAHTGSMNGGYVSSHNEELAEDELWLAQYLYFFHIEFLFKSVASSRFITTISTIAVFVAYATAFICYVAAPTTLFLAKIISHLNIQ